VDSLLLRAGYSLTIPWMALSVGFIRIFSTKHRVFACAGMCFDEAACRWRFYRGSNSWAFSRTQTGLNRSDRL